MAPRFSRRASVHVVDVVRKHPGELATTEAIASNMYLTAIVAPSQSDKQRRGSEEKRAS